MWVWLFILAAIAVSLLVGFGMMDDDVMPWSCPRCHKGGQEGLAGRNYPWYRSKGDGRYECRHCGADFREHANGTLVDDR